MEEIIYPSGIKWTKQRKCVYNVLCEAEEPLNAVQIYQQVERQSSGEEYAFSTIYRILSTFEEKGIVDREVGIQDKTALYALNRGGHMHYAVCLECHKRVPLQSCPFMHMHPERDAGDFLVTGHKLELYGYCKECREAKEG